eukprot:276850_1
MDKQITAKLVGDDTTYQQDATANRDVQLQMTPANIKYESTDNNTPTNVDPPQQDVYTPMAHLMRRVYHVITFSIIPILYLWVCPPVADAIGVSVSKILSFLILCAIVFEIIRLKKRWIIFGCREYERDHVSAQTWGTVSFLITCLLAFPRTYSISPVIVTDANGSTTGSEASACFGQIIIPLSWTLGFGDPLLGELKKLVRNDVIKAWQMYLLADIVLFIVWIMCFLWCGTPWWLSIIIPPIAILAEKPAIPHIDDNGLMFLVPLLFTLLFEPWFPTECNQIFYA